MKNITRVLMAFAIAISVTAQASTEEAAKAQEKSAKDCQAPGWAIVIGHEQKWKLHNGCPTDDANKPKDKDPQNKQEKK